MVIHVRAKSRICIPILMENSFDKNVYFYRLVIKLHPIQRFFFLNCSVSKNQIKLSKTLYCIIQYLSKNQNEDLNLELLVKFLQLDKIIY